jgi:hypothetical protein
MQTDPVVVANLKVEEAKGAYYAADDAHDLPTSTRLGERLTVLECVERFAAPTSNAGAKLKLLNVAFFHNLDPGQGSEAVARAAKRLAGKVGRGKITLLILREMRALMPACQLLDTETRYDGATAMALAHAIDWCARLRLV